MSEKDDVAAVLRRLYSGEPDDDKFEFSKIVRRMIIDHKIPADDAYVAISCAVARGQNYEIYTGNRWFDDDFRRGLEFYSTVPSRFEASRARAALLERYHVLALVPDVRDDLIASESAIEAIDPLNALMEGADAGDVSSQNALLIAETSPMTAEHVREFIGEDIGRKLWYLARRSTIE